MFNLGRFISLRTKNDVGNSNFLFLLLNLVQDTLKKIHVKF